MLSHNRTGLNRISAALAGGLCCLCIALSGCGGGGGGNSAEGVQPGPPPPNEPIEPTPPLPPTPSDDEIDAADLSSSDEVVATMTGVSFASPPTVTFTLVANDSLTVSGVESSMLRASFARLTTTESDFDSSNWTSYINTTEDPVCRSQADIDDSNNACTTFTTSTDPASIPQSALKVQNAEAIGKVVVNQATTESGGTLIQNDDGSWSYTLITDPGDPSTLATVHEICLQFSLPASANNPCIEFVPQDLINPAIGDNATSLSDSFYNDYETRKIVANGSCNSCHDSLTVHGSRTSTDYCMTCHNPDSSDANSTNTVDMKVMAHRIHFSDKLPSVEDGEDYIIWGFRNGEHNYSHVSYPQNANNCTRCHAGQEDIDYAAEQGLPMPIAEVTPDGHDWATYPGRAACESCHDDKTSHGGGGSSPCLQCHTNVAERHRDEGEELARALSLNIESATDTGPGQYPKVIVTLSRDGLPIDIFDFAGKIRLGFAWDAATDFDNEGISGFEALNTEVTIDASNSVNLGDNRFEVTSPDPVLDGQNTIAVMLFGQQNLGNCGSFINHNPDDCVAIGSVIEFYPSTASSATARREIVDIEKCDSCHHRLAMTDQGHATYHASPAENPRLCAGCHGPGLGFEVSADFRVLVHSIHASGIREEPYKGFDEEHLQYPGDLSNCEACHLPGTQTLPTLIDSQPLKGGTRYTTPLAATCASCHDDATAKAHMTSAGGAVFDGTQAQADNAIEACNVCHSNGDSADVETVHSR
jgi:OmcA/MtrC family decaheme c-type cytochrome